MNFSPARPTLEIKTAAPYEEGEDVKVACNGDLGFSENKYGEVYMPGYELYINGKKVEPKKTSTDRYTSKICISRVLLCAKP